jgi:hypothetical protein
MDYPSHIGSKPTPDAQAARNDLLEALHARPKRGVRGRLTRKEKDQIYADRGMTKVRGALGGIYYE